MTDPTIEITYEFPGILVINGAHGGGDIGIDTNPDGIAHGYRVCVYPGTFAEGTESGIGTGAFDLATENEPPDHELGDVRAEVMDEGFYLRLPPVLRGANPQDDDGTNNPCILITRGHVFGYWDDAGGACSAIVHRLPDGGGECDKLGCTEVWHDRTGEHHGPNALLVNPELDLDLRAPAPGPTSASPDEPTIGFLRYVRPAVA